MKRNCLVWCGENHSVAVGHEESGFNAKNARIGLTVSVHQGSRISGVPTASQSVISRLSASHLLIQYVNDCKACDDANSKADEYFQ